MRRALQLTALSIVLAGVLSSAFGCGDEPIPRTSPSDVGSDPRGDADGPAPSVEAPEAGVPDAPSVVRYDVPCGSDEVYFPEEATELHWNISCASALEAPAQLPEGASFDSASSTISWTPRLDQAGPFEIVLSDGTSQTRISGTVLDRFDAPGNVPLVDPTQYLEEHGLPVIHLTWHSEDSMYCRDAVARDSVPADIIVGGRAHSGAELRCRGETSLAFPKKSFTLKFTKDDPFHAPPSLAAFEGRRRLILTQTFDDVSQIRTRLAFELWNRLDPENVRIDQASAIVFIDGEYQGLYQVTDDVGDHLMATRGLDKNGNMFKSKAHSGNYRTTLNNGTPKEDLTVGYEKKEGEPADDFGDLITLLKWASDSSIDEIESTIDSVLRTEDFLDWYILATALIAYDNFAKNSQVYIDSNGPDRRFRYIPWDLNATFGQAWNRAKVSAFDLGRGSTLPSTYNGIWQRIVESPTLLARLEARYAAALEGPMSRAATLDLFDEMSAEVRPSALRDDRRWNDERKRYPLWSALESDATFDTERASMRSWIEQRWSYLTPLYVSP